MISECFFIGVWLNWLQVPACHAGGAGSSPVIPAIDKGIQQQLLISFDCKSKGYWFESSCCIREIEGDIAQW